MKITSRLGVLLAKIAGKEASLEHMVPPWATNAEEELMLEIADRVDGLESASVPEVETEDKDKYLHTNGSTGKLEWSSAPTEIPSVATADKGKYLHANESTGSLEWAEASGGGGNGAYLINDVDDTLDKTLAEIKAAPNPKFICRSTEVDGAFHYCCWPVTKVAYDPEDGYYVEALTATGAVYWECESESDYPAVDTSGEE